jgi:methylated-DNA-[protein]-cysteine S-methyltransferase
LGLTFAQIDDTPVGPLSFVAGDRGLRGVAFTKLETLKSLFTLPDEAPSLPGWDTVGKLLVEVNAYLLGFQRAFTVDIDWACLPGFQRQVLRVTSEIPYGRVLTYGAIANQLGKPGAARAVGWALGRNPMPVVIPCHRVIGSDHALHGYLGGKHIKAFLLTLEGHTISNHKLIRS